MQVPAEHAPFPFVKLPFAKYMSLQLKSRWYQQRSWCLLLPRLANLAQIPVSRLLLVRPQAPNKGIATTAKLLLQRSRTDHGWLPFIYLYVFYRVAVDLCCLLFCKCIIIFILVVNLCLATKLAEKWTTLGLSSCRSYLIARQARVLQKSLGSMIICHPRMRQLRSL